MKLFRFVPLFLVLASCQRLSPTTLNAADDEKQVEVFTAIEKYAALANVQVRVHFTDGYPDYAGWVSCPQKGIPIISINASFVSNATPEQLKYMDAVAAHEVCHVVFGDHKSPCVYPSDFEWRATVCGSNLQTCGKVNC